MDSRVDLRLYSHPTVNVKVFFLQKYVFFLEGLTAVELWMQFYFYLLFLFYGCRVMLSSSLHMWSRWRIKWGLGGEGGGGEGTETVAREGIRQEKVRKLSKTLPRV